MCGFPTSCLEIQLLALVGLDVMVVEEVREDGVVPESESVQGLGTTTKEVP